MNKPGTAGYSGTPLPKKLGIKPGASVALTGAPPDFERLLLPLPEGVDPQHTLSGPHDVIVCFNTELARLEAGFGAHKAALDWAGGLWIAWPKRASKVPTDLSDGVVRALGLDLGMVDNPENHLLGHHFGRAVVRRRVRQQLRGEATKRRPGRG